MSAQPGYRFTSVTHSLCDAAGSHTDANARPRSTSGACEERASWTEGLAIAVAALLATTMLAALLTTVLAALTAMLAALTALTALAGILARILRLLAWLLLLATLLLTGLLLALVRVLRILAHQLLPWDPAPPDNVSMTRTFRLREGTKARRFTMSKPRPTDV
jgi:hypothetical protein